MFSGQNSNRKKKLPGKIPANKNLAAKNPAKKNSNKNPTDKNTAANAQQTKKTG